MSASHGTNAVLKITSGSLRDVSVYVTSCSLDDEIDKDDVSTLGTTDKEYVIGLGDHTVPIEGVYDETFDGYYAVIRRAVAACEYYPNGTGSGKVKLAFNAFFTKYSRQSGVDQANKFKGELQVTGSVTRTVV